MKLDGEEHEDYSDEAYKTRSPRSTYGFSLIFLLPVKLFAFSLHFIQFMFDAKTWFYINILALRLADHMGTKLEIFLF